MGKEKNAAFFFGLFFFFLFSLMFPLLFFLFLVVGFFFVVVFLLFFFFFFGNGLFLSEADELDLAKASVFPRRLGAACLTVTLTLGGGT